MNEDPRDWIDDLPADLAPQGKVLRRLLNAARTDERSRILVVGCSIGRGVADEHSDIDAYIAVVPEQWSAFVDELPTMVERLGHVDDMSHKRIVPSEGQPYQLTWVLFRDGVQLELVVAQAEPEVHPRRDWVVLHDPDGRIKELQPARYASPEEVREWAYEGWSLLILCAKYLSRGSLWEALEMLHAARTRAWRLWAAAGHVADPQYGLTAVLDSEDTNPPPGIDATHTPLEGPALARAALACAELLNTLWPQAMVATGGPAASLPNASDAARRKLAGLPAEPVRWR